MAKGKKGKKDAKKKKGKKGKKGAKPKQEVTAPVVVEAPPPVVEPPRPKLDPCCITPDSCEEGIGCRPNAYPGLLDHPVPMAVVGSDSGSYESLCNLVHNGFRCADRMLMMTPWGNYVLYKMKSKDRFVFFLFDGCTCNVNRFRYYDLNVGTAGLLFFKNSHDVLKYMMDSKLRREHFNRLRKSVVDDICREYAEYGNRNIKKVC